MTDIEKALQELERAVKSDESVAKITVTITIKKPNPSKAPKS